MGREREQLSGEMVAAPTRWTRRKPRTASRAPPRQVGDALTGEPARITSTYWYTNALRDGGEVPDRVVGDLCVEDPDSP